MNSPHPYLDSLNNFESHLQNIRAEDFHLGRVKEVLAALGNPHEHLKVIHVAGTKGKGSTCMMLASILAHSGLKVGLYTSPHLHRVNERIRVLEHSTLHAQEDFPGSISDEQLEDMIAKIRPAIAALENKKSFITYFEALTIIAALYFQKSQVDWVVLETGLGGRLDATNVFNSSIAILTSISLDHTKILGETLREIAGEKAGIIKSSHQKVVVAPQEKEVLAVIEKRCEEFGSKPRLVNLKDQQPLTIALKGEHQLVNAACAFDAIQLLKEMGVEISQDAVTEGLRNVRWQGRFEIIHEHPTVVVDGAHNLAAAQALAKTMRDEYPQRKILLVLGLSMDKNVDAVCESLQSMSHSIILTKSKHPRAHSFSYPEAQKTFPGKNVQITDNVKEALQVALSKAHQDDVILVTGSLFIVAEARECINTME